MAVKQGPSCEISGKARRFRATQLSAWLLVWTRNNESAENHPRSLSTETNLEDDDGGTTNELTVCYSARPHLHPAPAEAKTRQVAKTRQGVMLSRVTPHTYTRVRNPTYNN